MYNTPLTWKNTCILLQNTASGYILLQYTTVQVDKPKFRNAGVSHHLKGKKFWKN